MFIKESQKCCLKESCGSCVVHPSVWYSSAVGFPRMEIAQPLEITCSKVTWCHFMGLPNHPIWTSQLQFLAVTLLYCLLLHRRVWFHCLCFPVTLFRLLLRSPYSLLFTRRNQPSFLNLWCAVGPSQSWQPPVRLLLSLQPSLNWEGGKVWNAWFHVWSYQCQVKTDENNNFACAAPSNPLCGLLYSEFWLNHTWFRQST